MEDNVVFTWRFKRNIGVKLLKKHYDSICYFIVAELLAHGKVTLTELMARAQEKLILPQGIDLNWCLLQVKLDLQARGLIKISFEPGCLQIIEIKPEAKRKIRSWSKNSTINSDDLIGNSFN